MTALSISSRLQPLNIKKWRQLSPSTITALTATVLAIAASTYSYLHGFTASYGDAESHLNIAKRVVDSITPGLAQLGGIWLPLPHVLLIPFVYFNFLWSTGLAGSIVSGMAYIVSAVYIYKLAQLLTNNLLASYAAAFVFMTNPNILYMQSTAMTELTLIVFFILSSYYFIRFMQDDTKLLYIILAAFFAFCASLSRYDGWALVLVEAGALVLLYLPRLISSYRTGVPLRRSLAELEGYLVLYSSLAFLGIVLWLGWDFLILGDPLYFMHSQFSAGSQQASWLAHGELPAYQHLWVSIVYYFYTSMKISGVFVWSIALIGLALLLIERKVRHRYLVALVLLVPFFFNIATLYIGQSVIFIPGLTPTTFEATLFNARYGLLMVPAAAICIGYLLYRTPIIGKIFVILVICTQLFFFASGAARALTLTDATQGLSSGTARLPQLQGWFEAHYDYGYVLVDDYVRPISLLRSGVPLDRFIYVGNKPYWNDSLKNPQDLVRWVIMSKNDTVWQALYTNPAGRADLFKYYNKVYTSDQYLVFRRISG